MTWILSALTILVMWLAGSKRRVAWKISLVNQCLWLGWIVHGQHWGLLPMNVAMFAIAGRNLWLWGRTPAPERGGRTSGPSAGGAS